MSAALYDVFLSHSSHDKATVRALAERLRSDGLRVWFDEWCIAPGDNIVTQIEDGLKHTRVLVLCMSEHGFGSEWVGAERTAIFYRDPLNKDRRVIPLLLSECDIPPLLQPLLYLDWRSPTDEVYTRLLTACTPPPLVSTATPPPNTTAPVVSVAPSTVSASKPIVSTGASEPGSGAPIFVTDAHTSNWHEGVLVLKEHTMPVWSVAFSPDRAFALSGGRDKTLRYWDLQTGACLRMLEGHTDTVYSVTLSADGAFALSGGSDCIVRYWDLQTGTCLRMLKGHTGTVNAVTFSPDGAFALSGADDKTIQYWDLQMGTCLRMLKGHTMPVWSVALSHDGAFALSGGSDKTIRYWDLQTGTCLRILKGNTNIVYSVTFSPDGAFALSGGSDKTIRYWDLQTGACLRMLKGHTDTVWSVAFSPDGAFALSGGQDKTLRYWDLQTGACLRMLEGNTNIVYSVTLSADGTFALSGSQDKTIRYWNLQTGEPANFGIDVSPVSDVPTWERYQCAKIVLLGESGVGKSGLALRLADQDWKETESTHGMNVTQIKLPMETEQGTEREVWLWDLAGQPEYRLTHQLFLDETSVGLVLFDGQKSDPFQDVRYWDKALRGAIKRHKPIKALVAARTDRGGPTVSQEKIDRFQAEKEFSGFYTTSAKTGKGCAELREAIAGLIPWERLEVTTSPRIFKALKDAVLALRGGDDPLINYKTLKVLLQNALPGEDFTDPILRTILLQLSGQGLIAELAFGDFYLLRPELLNAYAATAVIAARNHVDGIGCLLEDAALQANFEFHDLVRLTDKNDEAILLRAMVQTFVDKALCFREDTEAGRLLVFPSQYSREYERKEFPQVLVTYRFSGEPVTLYTTLVVRLRYSKAFALRELWKNAAEFTTGEGKTVGFAMETHGEGDADLHVFFDPAVPDDTKVQLIKYIHDHLARYAIQDSVERIRHYVCTQCNKPVSNDEAVALRVRLGKPDIRCQYCDYDILLRDLIEEKFDSDDIEGRVRKMERDAQIALDNESRELILVGHAFVIAGEANQIFRPLPNSDWGLDGEIEFKNRSGQASGKRIYLQLKSGDSYLRHRQRDDETIFTIPDERHITYWQAHAYDVYLVIRTSDHQIQWMNITEYLKYRPDRDSRQVRFHAEPFTTDALLAVRERLLV